MKKNILIVISIVLILMLAACSGNAEDSNMSSTGANDASTITGSGKNAEMPLSQQLLIGTFALESSDYAVDAEQAKKLLPLWKAMNSLSDSATTAPEEIEALINQIERAMTEEQISWIGSQEMENSSMQEIMTEMGIEMARGGRVNGTMPEGADPSMMQTRQASGQGQMTRPEGENGPGGMGMGSGENAKEEQIATLQAHREQVGGGMGTNSVLIEALIDLLEGKVS